MIVRTAKINDAEEMRVMLNEIVAIGGSTAIEEPLSASDITANYLDGPDHVCCFVAEDAKGRIAGFQALEHKPGQARKIAYSSTFARQTDRVPGIGTALFETTKAAAAELGITEIVAKIRADNVSGLAYYTKMGFVDFGIEKAVPLKDGTPVDRVSKRYDLKA